MPRGGGEPRGSKGSAETSAYTRRKTFSHLTLSGKLSTRIKIAYALPVFATFSLNFMVGVYALDFYVSLGANLAFLLFFTALARSFDVITDPLMAWITDSTRGTKWNILGRRRPYMLTGCIPYGVLFVLLFSPPSAQDLGASSPSASAGSTGECEVSENTVMAYWFGVFYLLFFIVFTYCSVPYEALGPELSDSYEERNNVFFTKKFVAFLGVMAAAGGPATIKTFVRGWKSTNLPCYPTSVDPSASSHYSILALDQAGDAGLTLPSFCKNYGEDCVGDFKSCLAGVSCDAQISERCYTTTGEFCFEQKYNDDRRLWFELEMESVEVECSAYQNFTEVVAQSLPGYDNQTSVYWYEMSDVTAGRMAFMICSLVAAVYFCLTIFFLCISVKERESSTISRPVPLVPSILRAFENRAFRPLLVGWTLDGLGFSALLTTFPFFVRYVIIPDGIEAKRKGIDMSPDACMGASVGAFLIGAMLSSPVWLWGAQRFGKYRVWLFFNIMNSLTNVLFLIPKEGDPIYIIIMMFINGLPAGGQFLPESILADVIDYDEFLNGCRSEGAFSVFSTLIPKLVAIPAGAIPLAVVYALGFIMPVCGIAQYQPASVRTAIRFCFVLLPFTSVVIGFFVKMTFPIRTREMTEKISAGIEAHAVGSDFKDPLTGIPVGLMEMDQDEESKVWVFENFTGDMLDQLLVEGSQPLVKMMVVRATLSLCALLAGLVVSGVTFKFLEDTELSIIPILSVIASGVCLCIFAVNFMRYRGALDIDKYFEEDAAAGHNPQTGPTAQLIERLLFHKDQGQRAGKIKKDNQPRMSQMKFPNGLNPNGTTSFGRRTWPATSTETS